jgi:hypothetical protein
MAIPIKTVIGLIALHTFGIYASVNQNDIPTIYHRISLILVFGLILLINMASIANDDRTKIIIQAAIVSIFSLLVYSICRGYKSFMIDDLDMNQHVFSRFASGANIAFRITDIIIAGCDIIITLRRYNTSEPLWSLRGVAMACNAIHGIMIIANIVLHIIHDILNMRGIKSDPLIAGGAIIFLIMRNPEYYNTATSIIAEQLWVWCIMRYQGPIFRLNDLLYVIIISRIQCWGMVDITKSIMQRPPPLPLPDEDEN